MRWIKPHSTAGISGDFHLYISARHEGRFDNNYQPAGQLLCWLKKPQPTEEFKDGQKSDYTLTEESI